jgi:hypothetical protein
MAHFTVIRWRGVTGGWPMKPLSLRGMIAPVVIALAIAAGFLDLWRQSETMTWLGLGFLALALAFAGDTRRMLASALNSGAESTRE